MPWLPSLLDSSEAPSEALSGLDAHLQDRSYLSGFQPSQREAELARRLSGRLEAATPGQELAHAARWARHLCSFSPAEVRLMPEGQGLSKEKGGGGGVDYQALVSPFWTLTPWSLLLLLFSFSSCMRITTTLSFP